MRIALLDPIHPIVRESAPVGFTFFEHYGAHPPAQPNDLTSAQAIVLRSGGALTAEMIDAARELRVIVRAGSGIDNIDLDAARAHGVPVCSVPGQSGNAVAELAIGLALASMRHVALADRQLRAGRWAKPELMGREIAGSNVGVLGSGAIGTRIGDIAHSMGARVFATVRTPTAARVTEFEARGVALVDVDRLLAEADVLFLAVPLTATTRNLVDDRFLSRMRPGSHLINVARGGVVDETAAARALESGFLAGLGMDVHETEGRGVSPLAVFENTVLSPHIGGMSEQAQERVGRVVLSILCAVVAGEASLPGRVA